MAEPASLRLLVPAVGSVSLLAARSLSAGVTAVALSAVTHAAEPNDTAATSGATKSHSENDFGLRMAHDVTVHESIMRCAPTAQMMDDDIVFHSFRRKFRKLRIQMITDRKVATLAKAASLRLMKFQLQEGNSQSR